MTDVETLVSYRLRQAEETIQDAEAMLKVRISSRSIVNRAYYAMFNVRQEADYKELVEITHQEAEEKVNIAKEFIEMIRKFTQR
jgi:uncharacterized protein (UPF0332 family)